MEKETHTVLIIFFFFYVIGMSAAVIAAPEQVDSKGGWIALGVFLGLTATILIGDCCLSHKRRKELVYDSSNPNQPFLPV